MPFPVCSSCSETTFLWELLVLHKIRMHGTIIKVSFTLFEYVENFPIAQTVVRALQLFQRAKRTHTNLLFVIRYYLTHTRLKITNNSYKIMPFTFPPLFLWGRNGMRRKRVIKKNGLIASRRDFSLLLGSNNKARKF